jgi:hypothetical protein
MNKSKAIESINKCKSLNKFFSRFFVIFYNKSPFLLKVFLKIIEEFLSDV